ncbi:hypothetical protein [Tissierella sp.]|uniref:hypothetical protein n=1 Tax=Tissierella sp. TaxID=41274 RepID=UPI002866700E|nr:hypothetical protein [Tissierella sp.]MDR7856499.1 hypothetical protein [Tissierella sp.]
MEKRLRCSRFILMSIVIILNSFILFSAVIVSDPEEPPILYGAINTSCIPLEYI